MINKITNIVGIIWLILIFSTFCVILYNINHDFPDSTLLPNLAVITLMTGFVMFVLVQFNKKI